MIDRLEPLVVGFAGLFEIVLLLLLTQPINRTQVAPWLKWLVGGAILYHFGYFLRVLLQSEHNTSAVALDRVAMGLLCAGLLLMPSAMLHAAIRLRDFNADEGLRLEKTDWRYCLLYAPIILLGYAAWLIYNGPPGDFIASIQPLTIVYLGWLAIANVLSAVLFLRVGVRVPNLIAKKFFLLNSGLLVLLTVGVAVYAVGSIGTRWEPFCRVAVSMLPLIPAVVFVWFTFKSRLLPVVFEQSIIYGGIVLSILLLHRLIITPIMISMRERFDVDFIIIEVLMVTSLIWWIRPLRRRAAESLRFLLSPNAFRVRDSTRSLAREVAQRPVVSTDVHCDWFVHQLRERFELSWACIVHRSSDRNMRGLRRYEAGQMKTEPISIATGSSRNLSVLAHSESNGYVPPEARAYGSGKNAFSSAHPDTGVDSTKLRDNSFTVLLDHFKVSLKSMERGEEETVAISNEMELLRCDVAFPMQYKTIDAMVLFGSRRRFDRLADEQINSLSVVIDQFAATLQNHHDEELRRHAERRSLQQEKLSTLGLISGSLAHELRNPLSSIRTIASLVSEDLSGENPNQHDLRLIVSEVDRLTRTLQRMLEFAKPAEYENVVTEPDRVISRLLSIMDYYAKELRIKLDVRLNAPESKVLASDAAMNEIFMNLIKNAMEAAKDCREANVQVNSETTDLVYRVTIIDNGTGISSDRLANIFLPFETSKPSGTGLGLYIVSERVRELRGTIRVTSEMGCGSTFVVELPLGEPGSI